MFWVCFGMCFVCVDMFCYVFDVSWICFGYVLGMFWRVVCLRWALVCVGMFVRYVLDVFWVCVGYLLACVCLR